LNAGIFFYTLAQINPMKTKIVLLVSFFCACSFLGNAQAPEDPVRVTLNKFADSLISAFRFENWKDYYGLSNQNVVKYYGGQTGYMDFTRKSFEASKAIIKENPEQVNILQLENDINQWQAVLSRTRFAQIDGKVTTTTTYLIAQSKDDGETWKFFDMGFNPPTNVIYMMPDVFSNLTIPQRKVEVRNAKMP
jgi:hypothetical protein